MKNILKPVLMAAIITFPLVIFTSHSCFATKTEIKVVGNVASFGAYSVKGSICFKIPKAGKYEIGKVTVLGTYNGPYPWIMRIYTDNTNYQPVAGTIKPANKSGLISDDGQFVIPLQINCPNMDKDEWSYVPDIGEEDYKTYVAPQEVGKAVHTECIIMGIDPRNADWVAGKDRALFTEDDNALGDITIATPFDIRFAADFDCKAIEGDYNTNVYIELLPAP